MINWILKILALLQDVGVLGYSRDGPPGTVDKVCLSSRETGTFKIKAHGLGLCLL
jgi:hypothetical protein